MSEEKKLKLVETGEKSRVITFRLGESVYSALEKEAESTGGTVSATARNILLAGLSGDPETFMPGDVLSTSSFRSFPQVESTSDVVVMLVKKPLTREEIQKRVSRLMESTKEKETPPHE